MRACTAAGTLFCGGQESCRSLNDAICLFWNGKGRFLISLTRNFLKVMIGAALLSAIAGAAVARPDCPRKIAVVDAKTLHEHIIARLRSAYLSLGCELNIVEYPGRRGVVEFNSGRVDGELNRQSVIEDEYHVPFVRTNVPLFETRRAIWIDRKSGMIDKKSPIGYLVGVAWNEEFVNQNRSLYRFAKYSESQNLISDFKKGKIAGFLATDNIVEVLLAKNMLPSKPTISQIISSDLSYHYLSAEFETFMDDLSEVLSKDAVQSRQ